jgi:hypothetical protein
MLAAAEATTEHCSPVTRFAARCDIATAVGIPGIEAQGVLQDAASLPHGLGNTRAMIREGKTVVKWVRSAVSTTTGPSFVSIG